MDRLPQGGPKPQENRLAPRFHPGSLGENNPNFARIREGCQGQWARGAIARTNLLEPLRNRHYSLMNQDDEERYPSSMNFLDFWPVYLKQHRHRTNRSLHLIGTCCYLALLAGLLGTAHYAWLWAVPVVAYGFAWTGHFGIEKNRPATFQHPWLSLMGDHKMAWLMVTGKIEGEYQRLGISQKG